MKRAAEIDSSGSRYRARADHELTVHLGDPARAMSIDHVVSVELVSTHVEIEIRDRGTLYAPYEAVHAVLDVPSRAKRASGSLGF